MGTQTAIYLRISDDREGRELGVQRQEEDCRALAARDGDTIVGIFKDNDIGASTRSKKPRPDYKRLLAEARAGRVQKIIAYTSGRLTRRPREHEGQIELAERHGIEFRYVASPSFDLNTAAGRRIARILAANDAGEAEDISERVRREKEQARARGEYIGGARAFGYEGAVYDTDGVITNKSRVGMVVVKPEAALIKDAVTRVVSGESLYAICREWTEQGIATPRGSTRWLPSTLKRVLTRPRNAGLIEHRGEVVDGVRALWPAIITEDEWRAVSDLLKDPKRVTYTGSRSLKWLGTNLFRCGTKGCGAVMRSAGVSSRGTDGASHAAYRCASGAHVSCRAELVDIYVRQTAREVLCKHGAGLIDSPAATDDTKGLRTKATAYRARLAELEDMLGDLTLSRAAFIRQRDRVQSNLDAVSAQLDNRASDSVLTGVADAPDPAAAFDAQTIERQRAIVDALMVVTILPGRPGRLPKGEVFDYSRIKIDPKVREA